MFRLHLATRLGVHLGHHWQPNPADMQPINDTWTHTHDIALILLALAYSTDADLADSEIDSISAALSRWKPGASQDEINEIVLESIAVFIESDPEKEVVQSVKTLGMALSLEKRKEVLEDAMRIAEADGVLLNSEQNLLSILANAWHIRETKERLLAETTVRFEDDPDWSVLHDLGLLYVIMAHAADGEISETEIAVMLDRLGEWEHNLDKDGLRAVLRTAIDVYASSPSKQEIQDSVAAIKDALPRAQRLVVLDDLVTIARADGTVKEGEKEIIESLSSAWNIDVRIAH